MSSRHCSACPTSDSARSCARSTGRSASRSGWSWRLVASCVVALAVAAACSRPPAADTLAEPTPEPPALSPIERAQLAVAEITVPPVVAVREAIQTIIPTAPPPVLAIHPAAVALVVEYEVTSPAHYTRWLQAPVWPGGASGATWGIGYDGGHQTRPVIARDWHAHAHVGRLAETAGIIGTRARDLIPGLRDVLTPYAYAVEVFEAVALPRYCADARRYYGGDAVDHLPLPAQGALCSLTYNRGPIQPGDRGREQREIRDVCVPAGDVHCIARALRAMCRLWVGTPHEAGLCRRRNAEAALAELPA